MVYAYVYAFIVYQKICKSLGFELGPYTSKIEVGINIDMCLLHQRVAALEARANL